MVTMRTLAVSARPGALGTSRVLVPKSSRIRVHPGLSEALQVLPAFPRVGLVKPEMAYRNRDCALDRTQEVGGSSPPSSIAWQKSAPLRADSVLRG